MRYRYDIYKGIQKTKTKMFAAIAVLSLLIGSGGLAFGFIQTADATSASYTFFGDASLVQPGHNSANAAQIESSTTVPPNYGGVDFGVPPGVTTLSTLNTLSSDYEFTNGNCGLGAPRFVATVSTTSGPENVNFYIGPYPDYNNCPQNIWQNTGNLASPTNIVDASQLGGGFYESYADVQAAYGTDTVIDVFVVTDAGTPTNTQTIRFDNTMIDSNDYTYEPSPTKDSCKDSGWMQFSNPSFKNQGQCVSWVEHNVDGHGQ